MFIMEEKGSNKVESEWERRKMYFKCKQCFCIIPENRIAKHHTKIHPAVPHEVYLDKYFNLDKPLYKCTGCSVKAKRHHLIAHQKQVHSKNVNKVGSAILPAEKSSSKNKEEKELGEISTSENETENDLLQIVTCHQCGKKMSSEILPIHIRLKHQPFADIIEIGSDSDSDGEVEIIETPVERVARDGSVGEAIVGDLVEQPVVDQPVVGPVQGQLVEKSTDKRSVEAPNGKDAAKQCQTTEVDSTTGNSAETVQAVQAVQVVQSKEQHETNGKHTTNGNDGESPGDQFDILGRSDVEVEKKEIGVNTDSQMGEEYVVRKKRKKQDRPKFSVELDEEGFLELVLF